jgi:hypothetical protein
MKEEYLVAMQAKITELETQIGALEKKVQTIGDAVKKQECQTHIADFKARKMALLGKLNHLGGLPGDTWRANKTEVDGVYNDLAAYIGKIYAKYTGSSGTGMF